MTTSGLTFASDDSLGGSSALPTVSVPASLNAPVPPVALGDWGVEMVYKVDSVPAALTVVLTVNVSGGTASKIQFLAGVGASRVRALAADGTVISSFDFTLNNFTGAWGRLQISTSTSGGTVSYTAQWIPVGGSTTWLVTSSFTGTPGRVTSVQGAWTAAEFGTLRLGHLSVTPGPLTVSGSVYQAADTGFAEETSAVRYVRLASEEDVPFTTPYGITGTAPVGPQRKPT
jgi:hypothetical protein